MTDLPDDNQVKLKIYYEDGRIEVIYHKKTFLGYDWRTHVPVVMGASEHRSSLYVLGKPGTGKSTFLVNCICQNLHRGFATFFLDPHDEAIREVFKRSRALRDKSKINEIAFFNPTNEQYAFGI